MSTRKTLLIGVSTLALTVGLSAAGLADQNFNADHTSNATAGGNASDQDDVANRNENKGNAFQGAQGVVSEVQNNGANAAINNGNSVSASIATGQMTGNVAYMATSSQTATQAGGSTVTETNVNDDNVIEDFAFQDAQGVFSKVQNNGAESAINNGNAVAAAILEGATGTTTLTVNSVQAAAVNGGSPGNSYSADPSSNDNDIRDSAFQNTEGVMSALQNNGPNSALNNGNSVAAVIGPGGAVTGGPSTFTTESDQSATVNGSNASTEEANTDTNQIRGQAFQNAKGVGSALQNNGANSALNNGNSVAAVVNVAGDGQVDLDSGSRTATAASTQEARVQASGGETNSNFEEAGSDDSNTITGDAFGNAQGVMSALQNNGANSAANNGNTVSAVIAENANGGGNQTFGTDSTQTARVDANPLSGNINEELASDDTNTLSGNSFQDAAGVMSALQNNGANSALNNGNTVSAFVMRPDVGVHGSPGSLQAPVGALTVGQSATVEANASQIGDPEQGNRNLEGDPGGNRVFDANTMTANTFETAEGVISALQNNGANSAINNGNTVSAIVANGRTSERTADFDTTSTQAALVTNNDGTGNNGGLNQSVERRDDNPLGNPDTNTIGSNAFRDAAGVMSAGQNNGANAAINNGNTVAAVIGHGGQTGASTNTSSGDELTATSTQTATVQSLFGSNDDGNRSEEANSPDSNTISGSAFSSAQGVGSVFQNNGANAAINNGNTVSAIITDTKVGSRAMLAADSRQVARVSARAGTLNRDQQGNVSGFGGSLPSDESNLITGDAFNESEGVFSVLQNNGPNSALNNGNTVAAFIADGAATTVSLDAPSLLNTNQDGGFNSAQSATVEAGDEAQSSNDSRQQGSNDSNRIDSNAFQNAEGVISALQNNGGNSAINNGNTVAAVIAQNGIDGNQDATFNADHDQTARVNAVTGTNASEAGGFGDVVDSDATNRLTGNAFGGAEGVFSVGQNNGANTAANNGNAVSAFIADDAVDVNGTNAFNADSTQTARVEATGGGTNSSIEDDDSDDTNTVDGAAFDSTQGVVSVLQNNGPNSAINNGNTVAAIINQCAACTGTMTFMTASVQNSSVAGGSSSAVSMGGSDNTNTIAGAAFANVAGVYSVTQNNGPNSAISNGNTVSAVIVNN